jgi:uncharacterized protein (DUF302 family)
MVESAQSSVVVKRGDASVAETVERLKHVIAERGFTLFRVIDHSGQAEQAGVHMPDSKLLMFGKPAVGASAMVATPSAGLDLPLKILVSQDAHGVVSLSYNSPDFLAERHHLDGALRAPFDAVASIVDAIVSS